MTDAALFYEAARSGLGDFFLDHMQRVIDALCRRPELGLDVGDGFRRALVRRFPFNVIYTVDANEIVVVAVAHQRHSPKYWKGRV